MSVPAWTNSYDPTVFGFHQKPFEYRRETYDKEGRLVSEQVTSQKLYDKFASRYSHTSNPIRYIGVLPWRDPSSYARTTWEYNYTPCDLSIKSGDYTIRYSGYTGYGSYNGIATFPIYGFGTADLSEVQRRTSTECLLRLADAKVSVGTALAEAKQSAEMLAAPFLKLGKALLDLKRGRIPSLVAGHKVGVVKSSRDIANLYLQWKYGWKPLCNDIYTLYQLSQEKVGKPLLVTATRKISSNFADTDDVDGWMNRVQNVHATNSCKLYASVSSSWVHSAQSIDVINPLSLIWEVIPFSFVIDWGIPIGNYLSALTANAGLDFVGGFESQCVSAKISAQGATGGYTGTPGGVTVNYQQFSRNKLGGFPDPLPYGKSPLSSSNIASALALWRQLM